MSKHDANMNMNMNIPVMSCLIYKKGEDTRRHTDECASRSIPNRDHPPTQKHSLRDTGTSTPERYLKARPSLDNPISESALYHPAPRGPLTGRAGR